jgi:hypothetical protein
MHRRDPENWLVGPIALPHAASAADSRGNENHAECHVGGLRESGRFASRRRRVFLQVRQRSVHGDKERGVFTRLSSHMCGRVADMK